MASRNHHKSRILGFRWHQQKLLHYWHKKNLCSLLRIWAEKLFKVYKCIAVKVELKFSYFPVMGKYTFHYWPTILLLSRNTNPQKNRVRRIFTKGKKCLWQCFRVFFCTSILFWRTIRLWHTHLEFGYYSGQMIMFLKQIVAFKRGKELT